MSGVIFDVDGVLLDSMPVWMHVGERYLERKGKLPEENLGEKLFTMSMVEGAEYIKKTWKLSESIEVICEEINQVVIESYQKNIPLKEGVAETLDELEKQKIPMVIATATDEHVVRSALQRLQIEGYFQRIFTCTEVGAGKSKPDIFYAAGNYLKKITKDITKDYKSIYVAEDSLYAAVTAKKAGFTVVGLYDEASRGEWNLLQHYSDIYSEVIKPDLFTKEKE